MTPDELGKLSHGWDSYGSLAPSPKAIRIAGELRAMFEAASKGGSVSVSGLSPSAIGGVAFYVDCFADGERFVEIWNDGRITVGDPNGDGVWA